MRCSSNLHEARNFGGFRQARRPHLGCRFCTEFSTGRKPRKSDALATRKRLSNDQSAMKSSPYRFRYPRPHPYAILLHARRKHVAETMHEREAFAIAARKIEFSLHQRPAFE